MRTRTAEAVGRHGAPWGWFLAWASPGACAALGLAALLSVGVILLAVAAVTAVLLLAVSFLLFFLLDRRRGH
ncbi:hypothetical protein [Streptomyces sp. AM6-12]|uniref:hypothetical protein n=1 Tax=Streptomyces sp. AM6-12 TaxID=3345149 RepID=UPI003793641E